MDLRDLAPLHAAGGRSSPSCSTPPARWRTPPRASTSPGAAPGASSRSRASTRPPARPSPRTSGRGDVRAVALLQDQLPERLKPVTTVVQGTRHADGGDPFTAQRTVDAVAERLEAVTDDLLAEYEQERGQRDKAVDGPADTLAALRMAQMDALIVTTQLPSDATAWFDAEQPGVVSLSRDDVTGLGGQQPQEAPLVDVLLRAVLGTGATVRVVPGDRPGAPQHGVGALLRFPVADETVA